MENNAPIISDKTALTDAYSAFALTDPVAQTTVQLNESPLNVLSESIFIHTLLIKLTRMDK
jgi:hypothetical protein